MNDFFTLLTKAICDKFDTDITLFVSKKKKHVHLSLKKSLYGYSNYKRIISFIRKKGFFLKPCILHFPGLNQSIKWHFDYILATRKRCKNNTNGGFAR